MKLVQRQDRQKLHVVKTGFKVTGVSAIRYKGKDILVKGKIFRSSDDMRTDMNEENDHGVLSSVIKNISDSWVNSNIKNNRKDKNTWIKEFSSQSYVKSGFNIAERKLEETKTEDKKDVRVQIQPDKEKKELEVWKEEQRQNIKTVFSQKHLHKSEISVEPVQQKQQKIHSEDLGTSITLLATEQSNRTKSKITLKNMAKFCNVNLPGATCKEKVTHKKEDIVRMEVLEEDIIEPWVCSGEEREQIRKKKQYRGEYINAVVTESIRSQIADKKEEYIDGVKKRLLKEYVIQEMIHDQKGNDPNAHFKLIGQMITHDAAKAIAKMMKLVLTLICKLLFVMLPVILIASVVAMVFVGLYMKAESPTTYFDGYYDSIQEVRENPKYIKNVIQEMERNFAGNIDYFLGVNELNEAVYAYGIYSEADDIAAAYLAQITTDPNYSKLISMEVEGYPAYLFIDTDREEKLLKKVFKQFNYTKKETVKKKVTNEKGKEEEKNAEKMTVYCLTIEKWKDEYEKELPETAQTILADLMKKQTYMKPEENDNFVAGEAVPIEDLIIPECVDENLIYLAGFIKAEAGNQSDIGKTAVAYVILNRAGGASGNIKGVLTAPYQFSCYIPYHTVEKYLYAYANMSQGQRETDSCYRAAAGAYYGTAENPIGSMKYYCNPKYCSVGEVRQWEKIRARNSDEQIKIIGDHVFCQNCW